MAPKLEIYDLELADLERSAFEKLQERVATELDENIYDKNGFIYRFLKAKNFDVDEAEKALKNILQWRKGMNVSTILKNYKHPEVLQKHFANNLLLGMDKEGSPVYYLAAAKLDIIGLLMSLKRIDVEKAYTWVAESAEKLLDEQSKKLNRRVNKCIYILDMDQLSFGTAINKKCVETLLLLIKLQLENYPERLKVAYFINTTNMFMIPFSIIKNYVPHNILKKVKIYGLEGWKEELVEILDEKQLPAFLGGERTDPDGNPLCKTLVFHGNKVDEKYYIHKSKKSLSGQPNVKKLVLSRASFSEIVLEVAEDGSVIEWEWEIKNKDIGFGLFYQEEVDGEEKVTELVSLQRLDTDEFPEAGVYKCEKAGTYIMLFDNSYSWIRSKEVYYRAIIRSAAEYESQLKNGKD